MSTIDPRLWNKEDAEILKAKYTIAVTNEKETFIIMGQIVNTQYAKYLVEYLIYIGVLDGE